MPASSMEELVSLCKRRGFIFQSSDIYGGLQGMYDYGPLGVELKNNLKKHSLALASFKRTIARALTDAIDRDFRLAGAFTSLCRVCQNLSPVPGSKERDTMRIWRRFVNPAACSGERL